MPKKKGFSIKSDTVLFNIRCSYDSLRAREDLKRGNLICYFDSIDVDKLNIYEYLLYNKYKIIYVPDFSHYYKCKKNVMDSVVFLKYGNDFYSKLNSEVTEIYNKNGEFFIEDNLIVCDTCSYNEETDIIIDYIHKCVPNLNNCKIDPIELKEMRILLFVDTTGYIKNVEIKKKLCEFYDNEVAKNISTMKIKFKVPIIRGKKQPFLIEMYLNW